MKNIGKLYAGELHVQFDEGGQGKTCSLLYLSLPYDIELIAHIKIVDIIFIS